MVKANQEFRQIRNDQFNGRLWGIDYYLKQEYNPTTFRKITNDFNHCDNHQCNENIPKGSIVFKFSGKKELYCMKCYKNIFMDLKEFDKSISELRAGIVKENEILKKYKQDIIEHNAAVNL